MPIFSFVALKLYEWRSCPGRKTYINICTNGSKWPSNGQAMPGSPASIVCRNRHVVPIIICQQLHAKHTNIFDQASGGRQLFPLFSGVSKQRQAEAGLLYMCMRTLLCTLSQSQYCFISKNNSTYCGQQQMKFFGCHKLLATFPLPRSSAYQHIIFVWW